VATKKAKVKVEDLSETEVSDLPSERAYHDQESEWESEIKTMVQQESDVRHVMRDFTSKEEVEGQSDLTEAQVNLLTVLKCYEIDYPGLGLENFAKWFNVHRLSLNRGSRKEKVEILRGQVSLTPPPGDLQRAPNRGF